MEKDKIYFLTFYDLPEYGEERKNVLATKNLVNYIVDELIGLGKKVRIISASTTNSTKKWSKGRTIIVNPDLEVRFIKSCPRKNVLYKILSLIMTQLILLLELFKLTKEDTLLAYHATSYPWLVRFTRRIKKYNLVLYVGEIYSDVSHDRKLRRKEFKVFNCADSFLLATDNLNHIINKNSKPNVIISGNYAIEYDREVSRSDKKIHCIYAGNFDERKGEVQLAIRCAEFLPENYCIDICGFGTENDISKVLNLIEAIQKTTKCEIKYHGSVTGESYIRLIQSCDIGLFTPIAEAKFNESDFPSKVLSYLANGLRVVSADVGPVRNSKVGGVLFFYSGSNPQTIAQAIQSVDINSKYDSRILVQQIRSDFVNDLNMIL